MAAPARLRHRALRPCDRGRVPGASVRVEPSRGAAHRRGPARGSHRRLRIPQPRSPGHRHVRRQLRALPAARRWAELLPVRRRRPVPDQRGQRGRRTPAHHVQLPLHDEDEQPQHVPLRQRAAGRPDNVLRPHVQELEPAPELHAEREPRRRRGHRHRSQPDHAPVRGRSQGDPQLRPAGRAAPPTPTCRVGSAASPASATTRSSPTWAGSST